MADIRDDPQIRAIGGVLPLDGGCGISTVGSSFEPEGVDKTPPGPAPAPGQHSAEVLRGAGYTNAEIEHLTTTKAFG